MCRHMTHERVKIADYGVHRFHHFFLPRQLIALWQQCGDSSYVCDAASRI